MIQKDIVSATDSAALALANEQIKALEAEIKKQDKALAKIADLIGLDERSQPFQVIDRVRTQAACQNTMDGYLEHIAETVGLPKGSPWSSIARRVSEVMDECLNAESKFVSMEADLRKIMNAPHGAKWSDLVDGVGKNVEWQKEYLAQASRDADEILHLKAKAKEWEDASRNARQQGFDEAVAVVDRCIEVDEEGIEKAKDRVTCLKNIAGALRGAVLCEDD